MRGGRGGGGCSWACRVCRFHVHGHPPITIQQRCVAGRVADESALRQRVFHSGVEPGLRKEAWKFLLGFYSFGSTHAERAGLRADKQAEYARLKAQWTSITEAQAARCALLVEGEEDPALHGGACSHQASSRHLASFSLSCAQRELVQNMIQQLVRGLATKWSLHTGTPSKFRVPCERSSSPYTQQRHCVTARLHC